MKDHFLSYITYDGHEYPVRIIKPGSEPLKIAPDSLDRALFSEDTGWYRDKDAIDIDGVINFYVPDHMLEMEENEIIKFYLQNSEPYNARQEQSA